MSEKPVSAPSEMTCANCGADLQPGHGVPAKNAATGETAHFCIKCYGDALNAALSDHPVYAESNNSADKIGNESAGHPSIPGLDVAVDCRACGLTHVPGVDNTLCPITLAAQARNGFAPSRPSPSSDEEIEATIDRLVSIIPHQHCSSCNQMAGLAQTLHAALRGTK